MGTQLLKAGTSVGSNYRAFTRARSQNERFAKICIVAEEGDETPYWLELFMVSKYGDKEEIKSMITEGNEILKVCSKIKNSLYKS